MSFDKYSYFIFPKPHYKITNILFIKEQSNHIAKVKKVKKPFARKIQILTVGEQRAKVMGKTQVASIFKKGKDAIRRTNNNK